MNKIDKKSVLKSAVKDYFKNHFRKSFYHASITQKELANYDYEVLMESESEDFSVKICYTSGKVDIEQIITIDLINKVNGFDKSYKTTYNVSKQNKEVYFYKLIEVTVYAFRIMNSYTEHYAEHNYNKTKTDEQDSQSSHSVQLFTTLYIPLDKTK